MFLKRLEPLLRLSAVRQTLWFSALFLLITLVAWGAAYWLVQSEMLRSVDARLAARMTAAQAALDAGAPLPETGPGETAAIVAHYGPEGFRTVDLDDRGPEMRYLLRTTAHGRILLGENTERQEELRDILAAGMQLSLLATMLATGLVGAWLAWRGQARLNVVSAGLADVAQGRLDRPIVLDGGDDLSLVADRINATTARLAEAMTRMRTQSSNIAHDLRTPLARLRAQIESSLSAAEAQNRAVEPGDLSAALEQIDQITGTFEALLRLARIESGAGRDGFSAVRLDALAERIAETFGPVVENADQALTLKISSARAISGDHDMLIQLAANLIQNALRHGAARQTIMLGVDGTSLSVVDEGPGVPLGEREAVFQPLYQGETSRQGEGFGLGLSLVRAIADLHDADLSLSDGPNGRGLCVTVRFPELTEL